MNPIAIFFGLALLAASVFFVASPFRTTKLQKKSVKPSMVGVDSLKLSPEKQRQAVLMALRDLDFDYQAGKVAEEDYQNLRANLLAEAAQLIEKQEREKEDSIEALIQSRRQSRKQEQPAAATQPAAVTQPAAITQPAAKKKANGKANALGGIKATLADNLCHHCQAPLVEGAKFCSRCGSPVEETVCPKCRQPLQPGDRFCPVCGTAAASEKAASTLPASPAMAEGE